MDQQDQKSKNIINRIACLIDSLLHHNDSKVRGIAEVGFIEALLHKLYEQNRIKEVKKHLLPYSFEIAKEVAKNSIYRFDPKVWNEA